MCQPVHLLNCGLSPSGRPGDHILLPPARVEVNHFMAIPKKKKKEKRKEKNIDTRPREKESVLSLHITAILYNIPVVEILLYTAT